MPLYVDRQNVPKLLVVISRSFKDDLFVGLLVIVDSTAWRSPQARLEYSDNTIKEVLMNAGRFRKVVGISFQELLLNSST